MINPPHSVIILTHGWTGSSVFSALLGRAGYWLGSETISKEDYDTFENADLVQLNKRLLRQLAPTLQHEHRFESADVAAIERASGRLDLSPYREFVDRCDKHGPWVWKDPRLTWTIRVWARVLDLQRVAFLLLTRDDLQAWISANTRRHVQSWRFTRRYNHGITDSNEQFARAASRPMLKVSFEDLLLEPERTLDGLNSAFGLSLQLEDLTAVCNAPLRKPNRNLLDAAKAALVFAKNYRERDGRGRLLRDAKMLHTDRASQAQLEN